MALPSPGKDPTTLPYWIRNILLCLLLPAIGFVAGIEYSKHRIIQNKPAAIEGHREQAVTAQRMDAHFAELETRLEQMQKRLDELQQESNALPAAIKSMMAQSPTIIPPQTAQAAPATTDVKPAASVNKVQKQEPADDEPGRCTAITKQGTRCKRKAQPGRDRCWQH